MHTALICSDVVANASGQINMGHSSSHSRGKGHVTRSPLSVLLSPAPIGTVTPWLDPWRCRLSAGAGHL